MRRIRLSALLVIIIAGMLTVTTALAQQPTSYELPGDQVFPEGVAVDPSEQVFFVSSTTDGTIFRGEIGNPDTSVFLPGGVHGRTTAVGLDVDSDGVLFIAGGASKSLWAYDTRTGALIAQSAYAGAGFINDVVAPEPGVAYFTDSNTSAIYRFALDDDPVMEIWLDLSNSPIAYGEGFNLNGIDATPDGQYLIVVQSNTGKLFRITIATGEIVEIALAGGATVTAGDGIELRGQMLYVVRNRLGQIDVVELSDELDQGEVVDTITDPSFAFPTTAAFAGDWLLVVNAQFNQRGGTPVLPFTVSAVDVNQ
mgnify:CR=1 FL=1